MNLLQRYSKLKKYKQAPDLSGDKYLEHIDDIIKIVTPIKNKDYYDGAKGDKGDSIRGKDGKDGKIIKTNVDITPQKVRDKLESLEGDARLDASAIKNIGKYASNTIYNTSSGGTTWGSITGTLSAQTDLQTVLNNKLEASDITGKLNIDGSNSMTGQLIISVDKTGANASQSNTHLSLRSATTPTKEIAVGFDNTNDYGFVQAKNFGIAYKTLKLNPEGGDVLTGGAFGVGTMSLLGVSGKNGWLATQYTVKVGGGLIMKYLAKTANYTLTETDYLVDCTANSFAITLPSAVTWAGQVFVIKNSGTGVITLNTTSSQTIDGYASGAYTLALQYDSVTVMSNGANWIIV